ncbi:hypothetical protein GGTG_13475 [Gaeumannomyces tritici R3-111a-1]|uniref:Uncharacterized protein n=1 Tax=Gaeumannomyces tritici (strain R3-111a-1) TaxID=644352 RepID=J3PIZ4_GAET3|nr:hypothetical protein GGTG_13475 [Gaeumannomyces tritici R3-111a-1]EJT68969.1 hypothetical protein GGTG_13475 [Gaeumannomyces tritici R3-111a-1]
MWEQKDEISVELEWMWVCPIDRRIRDAGEVHDTYPGLEGPGRTHFLRED